MSEVLILKRNKANIFRFGRRTVYPGITQFSDPDIIKEIKSHPSYQSMLDNRVHEEIQKELPKSMQVEDNGRVADTSTSDISEMNVKNAVSIIQETFAIPVLQDMYQLENSAKSRKSVLAAISDQIADIKDPSKFVSSQNGVSEDDE
jgi:hypothetical protein